MNQTCPVCKGNRHIRIGESVTSLYSSKPYELAYCGNCSHIFLSNLPSAEELDAIYKEIYNYESHLAIEDEKKWRIYRTVSSIRHLIPEETTIIDIGCMYGFALEVFRNFGYSNLVGIEIDKMAVEKCRKKGYNVFNGTFSQWLYSNDRKSDTGKNCIYISHVIEHIEDLKGFIDEVKKVLQSGDYLIVLVPNSKAFTVKLFRKYWGWWQVPVHLHHFSSESITRLMSDHGFSKELTLKRGADSLFWLSSLASFLGIKSKANQLSFLQRMIIKISSVVGRYWYFLGNEELVVVAKRK